MTAKEEGIKTYLEKALKLVKIDGQSMVTQVSQAEDKPKTITVILRGSEGDWELWLMANARLGLDGGQGGFKTPKQLMEG